MGIRIRARARVGARARIRARAHLEAGEEGREVRVGAHPLELDAGQPLGRVDQAHLRLMGGGGTRGHRALSRDAGGHGGAGAPLTGCSPRRAAPWPLLPRATPGRPLRRGAAGLAFDRGAHRVLLVEVLHAACERERSAARLARGARHSPLHQRTHREQLPLALGAPPEAPEGGGISSFPGGWLVHLGRRLGGRGPASRPGSRGARSPPRRHRG